MDIQLKFNAKGNSTEELIIYPAFSEDFKSFDKKISESLKKIKGAASFQGNKDTSFQLTDQEGVVILLVGLGKKSDYNLEILRRIIATVTKKIATHHNTATLKLDDFVVKGQFEASLRALTEACYMTVYHFDKYKNKKTKIKLKTLVLESTLTNEDAKNALANIKHAKTISESVNFTRDLINEPPNTLTSTYYAKELEKDVKANLKGVKIKILGRAELKKRKNGYVSIGQ